MLKEYRSLHFWGIIRVLYETCYQLCKFTRNMKHLKYYLIAFGFTWTVWIVSFMIVEWQNYTIPAQEAVFEVVTTDFVQSPLHLLAIVLFSLGVYGPLIAYGVLQKDKSWRVKAIPRAMILFAVVFALALGLIPGFVAAIIANTSFGVTLPLLTLPIYLVYQIVTSGTEEFGWRGYLLPKFLEEDNAVEAGWKSGWVWAIWHFPLVIYLYSALPIAIIIPTLIGFSFNIVGMSIIYAFLYVNSQSLLLAVIFHAMTNTFSLYLLGSTENPVVGFLPAIIVWGSVAYLRSRFGEDLVIQ